ncbi:hypothetical protein [Microbacterium sp.]|uniref:hypothetical protein n=1 Tax=Microbacterium sp. TaxID=51671 RepID=UPI003A8BAB40
MTSTTSTRLRLRSPLVALSLAFVTAVAGVLLSPGAAHAATSTLTAEPGHSTSTDVSATKADQAHSVFTLSAKPDGWGTYVGSRVRVQGDNYYLMQARVAPSGEVHVSLKRESAGSKTDLVDVAGTDVTVTAGQKVQVSLTASGTTSVTLNGTVTNLDTGDDATITAKDTSGSRLTSTGYADAWLYTSSGAASSASAKVADGSAQPAVVSPDPVKKEPAPVDEEPATDDIAANAGVPAGTSLKVHHGDLTITKANTVVSGLEVRGFIRVKAPGVIIENTRVLGRATTSSIGLVSNYSNAENSFKIRNSEIYAAVSGTYVNGIMGQNFTASNVHIHDVVDPIRIIGSNVTVENSVLEDNLHYASDPTQGGGASHDDSIQIQAGSNIKIRNNWMSDAHNAAIQITQGMGRVSKVTVSNNYINGGGCSVNLHETGRGKIYDMSVEKNTFGPDRRVRDCGVVAPTSSYPQMTSNTWEANGKTVGITRG